MPKSTRRTNPGLWNRKDRGLGGSGLSFEGSGRSDLAVWRDGVGLAVILALFGLWPLIAGHFEIRLRGSPLVLDGAPARALGIAAIALGACLHVHYFWDTRDRLAPYAQPALVVAALVFLGALGFVAYSTLI